MYGGGGGGPLIVLEVLVGLVCPLFEVIPSDNKVGN